MAGDFAAIPVLSTEGFPDYPVTFVAKPVGCEHGCRAASELAASKDDLESVTLKYLCLDEDTGAPVTLSVTAEDLQGVKSPERQVTLACIPRPD